LGPLNDEINMNGNILAIGDCNTLGIDKWLCNSWAERFGRAIGKDVLNLGHTMATTREGVKLAEDHADVKHDVAMIQFGLVDSWLTFRYSPYVLYYPDNPARKLMRKVVKKYKKICRSMKLTKLLGVKHMVPPAEYEANLVRMTQLLRASGVPVIYLVESPPHVDESRNIYLRQYNQIMANIARSQSHCRLIQCFDCLYEDLAGNLLDGTHLSDAGHTLISDRLIAAHMDGRPAR